MCVRAHLQVNRRSPHTFSKRIKKRWGDLLLIFLFLVFVFVFGLDHGSLCCCLQFKVFLVNPSLCGSFLLLW